MYVNLVQKIVYKKFWRFWRISWRKSINWRPSERFNPAGRERARASNRTKDVEPHSHVLTRQWQSRCGNTPSSTPSPDNAATNLTRGFFRSEVGHSSSHYVVRERSKSQKFKVIWDRRWGQHAVSTLLWLFLKICPGPPFKTIRAHYSK